MTVRRARDPAPPPCVYSTAVSRTTTFARDAPNSNSAVSKAGFSVRLDRALYDKLHACVCVGFYVHVRLGDCQQKSVESVTLNCDTVCVTKKVKFSFVCEKNSLF